MKRFTKGVLITAGCFLAGGVILGMIGGIGKAYTGERIGDGEEINVMRDVWGRMRGWDFRWRRGGAEHGLTLEFDGIEYNDNYGTVYGSFTDDSLRDADIWNLDLEIGGGTLTVREGDSLVLKKEGGPECQYYIEGDTFYLKQKCPVGGGAADLTLTLPEGIVLDNVNIAMGAGKIAAKDVLCAKNMEIEVGAGEITFEEVRTEFFSAEAATGSVAVHRLDAGECEVEVNMGSITLEDSLITGNLCAEVNMGDISVFLRDSYENHDYDVSCSMGNICIREGERIMRECEGLANSLAFSGNNSVGGSEYDLNCSMGSILVEFSGETDSVVNSMEEAFSEKAKIYGIEDNWPEEIGRENTNTTAENFFFEIQIEEPMTLVVSCVTESGELDLEIENERGKEIFEKDDIRTGEYEVIVKQAGTYRVCFDCEDHTGSLWIRPKK